MRRLISEQPITNKRKLTFDVKYCNDEGKELTASFWEKEEAEHFIIMFDHTTKQLNELKEKLGSEYSEAKAFQMLYTAKPVPKQDITSGEAFQRITSSICEVLKEKNKRYGNSALKGVDIFKDKSKVGGRIDDKLARVKNNSILLKNDVCDIIGYLIIVCQENGWYDFSDQID